MAAVGAAIGGRVAMAAAAEAAVVAAGEGAAVAGAAAVRRRLRRHDPVRFLHHTFATVSMREGAAVVLERCIPGAAPVARV